MAKALAYKILLFNERKKRVKNTRLAKAHYIEVYYGKRKIMAKTPFPHAYFKKKKNVKFRKKYLQTLIYQIDKRRLRAIEKIKRARRVKKKKILAAKRRRSVKYYRKKREAKAKARARKLRPTKRQEKLAKVIKKEKLKRPKKVEPEEENELEAYETKVKDDDYEYAKSYVDQEFFSKKHNKNLNYQTMVLDEKVPIRVDFDNIDLVAKELWEKYYPHFVQYIKDQGGKAMLIPAIAYEMDISNAEELKRKKDQRLDKNEQAISTQRMFVNLATAKLAFQELIEQFIATMTGSTGRGTKAGGNYLARSLNNEIYITGFTIEIVYGTT